jgi:hypothetical protein
MSSCTGEQILTPIEELRPSSVSFQTDDNLEKGEDNVEDDIQ